MAPPNTVSLAAQQLLWNTLWDRLLAVPADDPDPSVDDTNDDAAPEPTAESAD